MTTINLVNPSTLSTSLLTHDLVSKAVINQAWTWEGGEAAVIIMPSGAPFIVAIIKGNFRVNYAKGIKQFLGSLGYEDIQVS